MRLELFAATSLVLSLGACGPRQHVEQPVAAAPAETPAAPEPAMPPSAAAPTGSLVVGLPAEGTVGFDGFGPAKFGAAAEEVRIAWGGDLGDAAPSEPGGCHYLIPQPLGAEGFRVAFMIEGGKFARIDVRTDGVTAPGGGKLGMSVDEIRSRYGSGLVEWPHKYDPDGKYLRASDPAGGQAVLVFETDAEGRVDEWRIGVPPQIDYVEGCS